MRRILTTAAAALIAGGSLLAANTATAAVTFDAATGTGFVGKGDVQVPFGWSDATLQSNAAAVTFRYDRVDTHTVTCEWVTGGVKNRKTHTVDQVRSSTVASAISRVTRTNPNSKVTGFNLTGIAAPTVVGAPAPQVGDACLGGGTDGTVTDSDVTGSAATLYATHGALNAALYVAPAVVGATIG
jgi:hypothetical protein